MNKDLLMILGLVLACIICVLGFLGMLTDTFLIILLGIGVAINLSITGIFLWVLVAFARFLGRCARK
jgi:hypothetical protein